MSLPVAKPVLSSIRDHCKTNGHRIRVSNFSVVASPENGNLRTLEPLYIQKDKTLSNIVQSALPLHIS